MILVKKLLKYFLFSFFILLYSSCSSNNNQITIHGYTMGTTYSITIANFKDQEDVFQAQIDSLLILVNKYFSTYLDSSEISKINNQNFDSLVLSDEFLYVLKKSLYYCEISEGNYDVTIAPLVDLWGFGHLDNKSFPSQKKIQNSLKNVGYKKVIIQDNILLNKNNVKIDLNSIAKGHGVDRVFEYILQKGYSDFLVEIGGEIRSSVNQKDAWIIGIQNPNKNSIINKVKLANKSMATSGNYNNFFTYEDKNYSHIIDPKTGYPYMHNSISATIISDKCIDADAYATLAMTMSPDKIIEIINKDENSECYILEYKDNYIIEHRSSGFDAFIF
ncbi:MAG: hypothetical protein CMG66_01070 [Candidatus Marinimicrobia bacterium]|nr:hypothetical protein [Candidatus Neomarinimicrobiota bacterium]|tara:strand:+ start:12580 stop:13575 length:996 start_codon:yes stop_codon:yes gene_type:complete